LTVLPGIFADRHDPCLGHRRMRRRDHASPPRPRAPAAPGAATEPGPSAEAHARITGTGPTSGSAREQDAPESQGPSPQALGIGARWGPGWADR
jgi:hypothetical protein